MDIIWAQYLKPIHKKLHDRQQPLACRVGYAAERLEDATFEMQVVATVVEATSQPMARRDPLRPIMDLIYAQVRREPLASVH